MKVLRRIAKDGTFWQFPHCALAGFEHKFASSQSQCWWMRLGGSCKLLSSILSPKFSYKCLLRILHKGLKTLFKHKVCKLIKEQRAYKFSLIVLSVSVYWKHIIWGYNFYKTNTYIARKSNMLVQLPFFLAENPHKSVKLNRWKLTCLSEGSGGPMRTWYPLVCKARQTIFDKWKLLLFSTVNRSSTNRTRAEVGDDP